MFLENYSGPNFDALKYSRMSLKNLKEYGESKMEHYIEAEPRWDFDTMQLVPIKEDFFITVLILN